MWCVSSIFGPTLLVLLIIFSNKFFSFSRNEFFNQSKFLFSKIPIKYVLLLLFCLRSIVYFFDVVIIEEEEEEEDEENK